MAGGFCFKKLLEVVPHLLTARNGRQVAAESWKMGDGRRPRAEGGEGRREVGDQRSEVSGQWAVARTPKRKGDARAV